MDQTTEKICLTVEQAAEALGLCRPTVLDLTHSQSFPSFRVGKRILIPRNALVEWANQRAREGVTQQ